MRVNNMNAIKLRKNFISVSGESFGGNQEWFYDHRSNIYGQGCGIIATVDTLLYLNRIYDLSLADYQNQVQQFMNDTRAADLYLHEFKGLKGYFALGILPHQMVRFLNKECKEAVDIRFKWNGLCGHRNLYEKICTQLKKDIPVIMSLYRHNKKLKLYTRKTDGGYVFNGKTVNNHYVTVTGIYEDDTAELLHSKMIEVSSWGKCYYIDYDEFCDYVGASLISKYCSNIITIRK